MKLLYKFASSKDIQEGGGNARPRLAKQLLGSMLAVALAFATTPQMLPAYQGTQQDGQQDTQSDAPPQDQAPARTPQTPEQLQELVAPIALYPDSLVAQILAASTYPEQVVEADRWVQAHQDLKGDDLAREVDKQNWDPSVKALTAFPSVLANMDKNISWTSSLGDAYYNQEQDVMDAIQVMRQKAQDAGHLKTTEQQVVKRDGSTIVVEPSNPEVVYVPAYNPWAIYGYPIEPWPGWYPYPGIWFGGPYLSFGVGFGIGFFGGYGWGWPRWGFDWHNHYAIYNHNRYYSRSNTFYNRNSFYRGGRGGVYGHAGVQNRPFGGDARAARGFEQGRGGGVRPDAGERRGGPPAGGYREAPRGGGQSGVRSGAFGGYGHGGEARAEASRGSTSMGGGGSHGGGRR